MAWERAGKATWRKCRPSSSPRTPESESTFYQVGPPAAPGGLCQVTWCLTLVVGYLLTHPVLWLNSFNSTSPFNPETHLVWKQAFIEAQKSCYWGQQRYHEKTVSGSVFPKGEIGKLRPSLWRSGWPSAVASSSWCGHTFASDEPGFLRRTVEQAHPGSGNLALAHSSSSCGWCQEPQEKVTCDWDQEV